METIIRRSIEELNEILPKEKKLIIDDSTPLIDEQSKLESIDLVNLFVNIEKNLKKEGFPTLSFDEMLENINQLKTIGSLNLFLINKLKNEKNKVYINVISNFNHNNFVGLLKNSDNFDWQVSDVDYNQVFQTLTK